MFLWGHSKDSRCCMILSHAMSHLFRGVQILLTGTKQTFDDSDEDEAPPPKKKAKAWKDINRIQLWHQSHQTLTDLWELFGHVFYNIWDGPVLFFACKVAKPADDDDEDDEWTGFWVRGLKVQICQSFSPMQRVNQVGPIVQVGSTLSCFQIMPCCCSYPEIWKTREAQVKRRGKDAPGEESCLDERLGSSRASWKSHGDVQSMTSCAWEGNHIWKE